MCAIRNKSANKKTALIDAKKITVVNFNRSNSVKFIKRGIELIKKKEKQIINNTL